MSIFGHDVIPEGFEKIGDEQIIVSTSFGLFDQNKVFLNLDLSTRYRNVHDLRVGHEILPLYPDKAPKRLGGRAKTSGSSMRCPANRRPCVGLQKALHLPAL